MTEREVDDLVRYLSSLSKDERAALDEIDIQYILKAIEYYRFTVQA